MYDQLCRKASKQTGCQNSRHTCACMHTLSLPTPCLQALSVHLIWLVTALPLTQLTEMCWSFCSHFNSFTAAACNISGLKDARTRLWTVYFPFQSCNYLLSMLCVLMKILLHTSGEKKTKRLKGLFQILHFKWSFLSDTRAVKGLMVLLELERTGDWAVKKEMGMGEKGANWSTTREKNLIRLMGSSKIGVVFII